MPFERVLAVGAHPDDCEFHAGGTLAALASKGARVSFVVCTDGAAGGQVGGDALIGQRRHEAERAAEALGVAELVRLGHPDGGLLDDEALIGELVREIRRLLDATPGERMMVGEVFLLSSERVAPYYGRNDELHLAFNFPPLFTEWNAEKWRRCLTDTLAATDPVGAWPTWVLSNHDFPRHRTRYGGGEGAARAAAVLLLTLRGTPFLYQGEEIGMRNVPVPEDRLQDPLAFRLHPKLSRDPSRTPLPWEPGPGAGFTRGDPWLPIGADADRRNVAAQRSEPDSLLHLYRALLALRKRTPALHRGAFASRKAPKGVFAFERSEGGQRAVVALNFGDAPALVSLGRTRPGSRA